ncbi:MAG: DUF6565 domain-containing protein [Chitinophagales bacterium]
MKKLFTIFALTVMMLGCNSFSGKETYMKEFEQFILIIKNRPSITEEEWAQFDAQFSDLSEVRYRAYEKEFTRAELSEIEKWRSEYQYRRFGAKLKKGIKESIHNLHEIYEGLTK